MRLLLEILGCIGLLLDYSTAQVARASAQQPSVSAQQPSSDQPLVAGPQVGDRLARISCPPGYGAWVYAVGLQAPDGLVFDDLGRLCVVEESGGRVVRFDVDGQPEIVAQGLHSPEGICAGADGELFVVEDGADGRLLRIDPQGKLEVLAEQLDAPEGVILVGDTLYLTESTLQLVENSFESRTRVLALQRLEHGWSAPTRVFARGLPYSFAELLYDPAGELILVNELAGDLVHSGLVRYSFKTGRLQTFVEGLRSPEGLTATPDSPTGFPLYVAEEDLDGEDHGRISLVDLEGNRTDFATGFGTLEDVVIGPNGHIFASEDSTGMVIEIKPIDGPIQINLWAENKPDLPVPTLTVYRPKESGLARSAVVICPGGGYGHLAMEKEGHEIARWLADSGVIGAVLQYRLPPKNGREAPLNDARRALEIMRENAAAWGLKPDHIGIMGFSAGGHLAAAASVQLKQGGPNFSVLIYPVISMTKETTHPGSRQNLLGSDPTDELVQRYSSELAVNAHTPPAFLIHTSDDPVKVENSLLYYHALQGAGVNVEMHIFARGGHGYGMRKPELPVGSWPQLLLAWMEDRGLLPSAD
jgi:acetyl esterase/lipase